MNRPAMRRRSGAARLYLSGLALVLAAMLGCNNPQTRFQVAEEPEHDRYDQLKVGDVTKVGNAEPIKLQGVGVVVGLDGTGGEASPDIRAVMEDQLRRMKIPRIKEFLNSPENAV